MKRTFEEQCKRMQQTLGQDTCPFDGEELDRRILTATQAQGTHSATLHRRRILQLYGKTAAMLLIISSLLSGPVEQLAPMAQAPRASRVMALAAASDP